MNREVLLIWADLVDLDWAHSSSCGQLSWLGSSANPGWASVSHVWGWTGPRWLCDNSALSDFSLSSKPIQVWSHAVGRIPYSRKLNHAREEKTLKGSSGFTCGMFASSLIVKVIHSLSPEVTGGQASSYRIKSMNNEKPLNKPNSEIDLPLSKLSFWLVDLRRA